MGHGVMSGERYTWHGGELEDSLRFIEMQYDTPFIMEGGLTLLRPQGHALFVPPNSSVEGVKVLGWLYNEDGLWVGSNTTVRDCFVRTNDDSIRFYAGALDGFKNLPPPPRLTPSHDILVERLTVHQSFNGAVVQIGWENSGIVNSLVRGVDVIGAEWYWVEQAYGPPTAPNQTAKGNDAILSLQGPQVVLYVQSISLVSDSSSFFFF
jgi:hypothetical protein